MITVNANLFRIVYTAVSTEETRYYLNGVHIEAHPVKGAILVATDGHRMIVAHDPDGGCSQDVIVQLPRFALAQCKPQAMFTTKRLLTIDPAEKGSATIKDVSPGINKAAPPKVEDVVTVHRVIIDGKFLDWRRVVPKEPTMPDASRPTAFNPRYMKAWVDVGLELKRAGLGSEEMQIGVSNGGDPTIIRWSATSGMFGVQMPMRGSISGFLPDFIKMPEVLQAAE